MTINLYQTSAAKNVLNKTNTLTSVETYANAVMKDNSSIMTPTIILTYSAGIFAANYMYIPEFNRYYYIINIVVEKQRVFIEAKCDVLMSYLNEIGEMSAYIMRSENLADLYMNDKMFRVQNNRLVETILFKNGSDSFTNVGEYILVVAGPSQATPVEGGDEQNG